jgi:hypothetical protein
VVYQHRGLQGLVVRCCGESLYGAAEKWALVCFVQGSWGLCEQSSVSICHGVDCMSEGVM